MSSVPLNIHTEATKRRRKSIKRIPKQIGSCTINHDSWFKVTWDWFVLALVLYTAIEIPFAASFKTKAKANKSVWEKISSREPIEILNFIVDVMFIIDILINFRTTYVEEKTQVIINKPKEIAIHYLKSWFIIDFVAAIPFDFFIPTQAEGAANLAGLLKTARLLRLIRVSRKMDRYSEFGLAVVFLLTSLFTLIAHWLACLFHVIGDKERDVPYGWIQLLATTVEQPINKSVPDSGPDIGTRYITALYFTITSLTSIGFGNVAPNTDNEKIFSVLMMLLGALFYAVIFGNLTAIIQRLYSRTARYHTDIRVVNEFLAKHDMPDSLQGTLREYFTNEQAATRGDDIESIMYRFPESLQAEIRVNLNKDLFDQFIIFDGISGGCLRALATVFRIEVFPHQHSLLKEGDQVTKLYFIVSGTVDVMRGNQRSISLGPGEVVGCNMVSLKRRPGHYFKSQVSLVAKVSSQVHLITWQDLIEVMKVYPEIKKHIVEELELSYNLDSSNVEDQNSNEQYKQKDHIELINMATRTRDDHMITTPNRRKDGTMDDTPYMSDVFSDQQINQEFLSSDERHLEKLEAKLNRIEDVLAKILVSLEKKGHVTLRAHTGSTTYV